MDRAKKSWMILIMLMAVLLTACSSKSGTIMREFSSADKTVAIRMDESWNSEDMGVENWVAAFTGDETEGIVVMQMPKTAYNNISDIGGLRDMVEESFSVSGVEEMEKPEISGLSGIEAYKGRVNLEDVNGDGFIVYGETEYAYYSILYAAPALDEKKTEYFQQVCATLKESVPEEVQEVSAETGEEEAEAVTAEETLQPTAASMDDVLRWFNATCAILIQNNGWDYNIYGGLVDNETNQATVQQFLVDYWAITDRSTAEKTLKMLEEEGHGPEFANEMTYLKELGIEDLSADKRKDFMIANFTMSDAEAQTYVDWYTYYETNKERGISAWDYSRMMTILADSYLAGYYTKEEALDASLEIAKAIQNSYESWDQFMEGYFVGYEFWTFESSDERRTVYEELKAASDSPYNIEWNLPLEKCW
ncbi:MAG: DUF1266 domain-containing protein [Lachnospiraceae bacterium]|nr:DUF1266 domain-containing protein [Lachnospiraceae bacterium]